MFDEDASLLGTADIDMASDIDQQHPKLREDVQKYIDGLIRIGWERSTKRNFKGCKHDQPTIKNGVFVVPAKAHHQHTANVPQL